MSRHALLLDCSTANAAWAFIDDKNLLAGDVEIAPPSASVTLADHLQKVFAERHELLDNLGAVYVAIGPGSFTGLRVGLALGKGIAYASHVPLIGFSSLQSIAFSALAAQEGDYNWVAAIIDAKKHEVYAALYKVDASSLKEIIPAGAYSPADFSSKMSEAVGPDKSLISGTGSNLINVENATHSDITVTPAGLLAFFKNETIPEMSDGELYNSWNLRPFYARLSEAEIGLINRMKQE